MLKATLILLLAALSVQATPYWTPEQIAAEFASRQTAHEMPFRLPEHRHERSTLDDRDYFTHYRMLCDFLASMQYSAAGVNNGGMIEGESGSDHNIIQTDNTQEAIRVWSQYAIWTGDTAHYAAYIRRAQAYCQRYPAWNEEGGGYYAAHNCGWGFEAVKKYREAYGDTSWNWYADQCATWVMAHPLTINPNSTDLGQLDPLAEGLAIGGMYAHTLYRQRADWQDFTLTEARLLRRWFESNPARLYANESWALCGGTALWGICESLFTQYPDSGRTWLNQYGHQLDVWQPTGQWSNAFNTWYCNAQHRCFELTQDSLYRRDAVFITDSLIAYDTDHDGGIPPGNGYPVTNDHTWVSSYMGWMGMERFINHQPARDVAAVGFASPHPLLPHLAGDSLIIAATVRNGGFFPMAVWVYVSGSSFSDSTAVTIASGRDSTIIFNSRWVVADAPGLPPVTPLHLRVSAAGDLQPANDTITVNFDLRRGVDISGGIFGRNPNQTVAARVEFYHEAYPDSAWTAIFSAAGQSYSNVPRHLMAGWNTIRVYPDLQYMPVSTTLNLQPDTDPPPVNFHLPSTDIALIDDDGGDTLETFFQSSLDSFALNSRRWNIFDGEPNVNGIPTVIWFTSSDSINPLNDQDQQNLRDYVQNGGHLLLTGQNITDALVPPTMLLQEVLRCSTRTGNTLARRVDGISGNFVSDSLSFFLIGNGGARNQTSPSSIYVLDGATEILRYTVDNTEPCGAAGNYGTGKFVFLSFGLEAVSGANRSTTRDIFLERCFGWFGDSSAAVFPRPEMLQTFELSPAFPNPFNPSTEIRFTAPVGMNPVTLDLYNVLGQKIATLFDGVASGRPASVMWDGRTDNGLPAASGIYYCRLHAGSLTKSLTLHLVR